MANAENTPTVIPDRREAIEAAFAAVETAEKPAVSEPKNTATEDVKGGHVATTEGGPDVRTPKTSDATADAPRSKSLQSKTESETPETPEQTEDRQVNADRPPQAWKPAQKAKWAALDPDIRQEVLRREHETTRVLNDSAQARQLAQAFNNEVQPYMARLNSMNAHPLVAVRELLKADHLLTTAPPTQRAQYMAKLITDYGVDIQALDAALSGRVQQDPAEQLNAKVDQLLQQRLAPFQQFLSAQQQQQRAQQQQQQAEIAQAVESMASDAKYPYFDQVRETMADIIELGITRNRTVSIETAYNQAVAMDPIVSQEAATRAATEAQATAAAKLNGRAQRALNASVSVGGAPSGVVGGTPSANNRRATIAAAFDAVGGR